MKKKLLFILLIINNLLYSQNDPLSQVSPIPPTVESFLRYGEIPVSQSTGVPQIEIPIYTIKVNDITIPITISYHGSGIKVSDVSSEVGLGWVLNTCGMITQNVIGNIDGMDNVNFDLGDANDILKDANEMLYDNLTAYFYYERYSGIQNIDKYTDRFMYIMPDGTQGVFREDIGRNDVHLIPYKPLDIKIHPKEDDEWDIRVLDAKGIVYDYEEQPRSQNYNIYYYPKRIISSNKKDYIEISYQKEVAKYGNYTRMVKFSTNYPKLVPFDNVCADNGVKSNIIQDYVSSTRGGASDYELPSGIVTNISTPKETIEFTYNEDRIDRTTTFRLKKRLVSITIKDKISGEQIKKVVFGNNHYFGSKQDEYRLKLEYIKIYGKSDNVAPQVYMMNYNSLELPAYADINYSSGKEKYYNDYWGYYNGKEKSDVSLIPDFLNKNIDYIGIGNNYFGNFAPNELYAKACILESIIYPTGGYSVFNFESNKADGKKPYNFNNSVIMGGLRIKSIVNYDSNNENISTKSYKYEDPHYKQISKHNFSYTQGSFVFYKEGSCPYSSSYYDYTAFTSYPIVPITMFNGASVLYGKVTEYDGTETLNNGWTTYYYQIDEPQLIAEPELVNNQDRFLGNYLKDAGYYSPQLIQKTIYENNNGISQLIENDRYSYELYHTGTFNTGINLASVVDLDIWNNGNCSDYSCALGAYGYVNMMQDMAFSDTKGITDALLISEMISEKIDDNGNAITSLETYDYNDYTFQKTKCITNVNEKLYTKFRYPIDYNIQETVSGSVSQAIKKMIDNHIIGLPIEEIQIKEKSSTKYVIDGKLHTYKLNDDKTSVVLDSIYKLNTSDIIKYDSDFDSKITSQFKKSNLYETEISFDSYSDNGKPTQVTTKDGLTTSYVWGYNNQYPIAKIENSTYTKVSSSVSISEVQSKSNADNDHGIRGSGTKEEALRTALDKLRYIEDAVVTTYTYDPLIGMTSQTDPNGRTTYYDYDDFGRLEYIKNQDGYIIKQFKYKYATSTNDSQDSPGNTGDKYLTFGQGVYAQFQSSYHIPHFSVGFQSNVSWTVTVSGVNWVKDISPSSGSGDGQIILNLKEGEWKSGDVAIITVSGEGVSAEFKIIITD